MTDSAATPRAQIEEVLLWRAVCVGCGLFGVTWVSPWFTLEFEARRAGQLHNEAMGHDTSQQEAP